MAPARAETLRVALAATPAPGEAFERTLEVPAGATVADVIAAARVSDETSAVGIWGRVAARDTPVADGDRVELYRPLPVDAMEARRRRAAAQRKAQKAKAQAPKAGQGRTERR